MVLFVYYADINYIEIMQQNNIALYRTSQLVWYLFFIIQTILGVRFVLRLLGANPEAAFTQFVYSVSETPLAPFSVVFDTTIVAGAVIEWSTLLAIIAYGLLAQAVVMLLSIGRSVPETEADAALRNQEKL